MPVSPLDFMRSTAAHEFKHAIQFGYDASESLGWLWESTATWVETVVYPEITETNFFLEASFKSPDSCQVDFGGRNRVEDRGNWYAHWLFLRFLSEKFGDEIVRTIWEQTIDKDGYEALEAALAQYGTSFDAQYQQYTVALLLRNFDFGLNYPTIRLEGSISAMGSFAPKDGIGQVGADFVEIDVEGVVSFSLWNLKHGMIVGVQGDTADIYLLQEGSITIETGAYQHVYLIIHNLSRALDWQACRISPYTVRTEAGEVFADPDFSLPSTNFRIPFVEPLLDPNNS